MSAVQLLTIDVWRDLVARLREPRPMPTLSNTDGDPFVMTTDHFDIVTPEAATVIARLAAFPGAEEMFARAQRSSPRGKGDRRPEEPPEFKVLAREFKERHMTAWVDEAIPALGGLTPREASKAPRTRKDLDLLLRELENRESRLPADERFDVGRLRAVLGI